jgi:hypothetical protein
MNIEKISNEEKTHVLKQTSRILAKGTFKGHDIVCLDIQFLLIIAISKSTNHASQQTIV